jgi:UDP-glucuronate 4-epimerase
MNSKNLIVTGGAGFIGSHLSEFLLEKNYKLTVIDNFDSFYPRKVKQQNIAAFKSNPNVKFIELDILQFNELMDALSDEYDAIIHLAAKAGVRPSIENPKEYQKVNVEGTQNLLEIARIKNIKQFLFASSSSVYGINQNIPWSESDGLLKPISPYASTKISCELMGHVYSHLYGIRFISMRFFTVYGPRQRPDLAINTFSRKILNGETIPFFGNGNTKRDYTYVSDIVDGIYKALQYNSSMYEIFNFGNSNAIPLAEMLNELEFVLNKKAIIKKVPEQPGDVSLTYADIEKAKEKLGYKPVTGFRDGLIQFKEWFMENRHII